MSRAAMRLYRAMLRLYPGAFRRRFGATMCETFEDSLWSAKQEGPGRVLLVWVRGLLDALWLGTAECLRSRRSLPSGPGRGPRSAANRSGFLRTIAQDALYALRGFRKAPGFTAIATLTLALGVGANTAMFSVVNGVLLTPLPYEEPDELVIMGSGSPRSLEVLVALREASSFVGVAGHSSTSLGLIGVDEAEEIRGAEATADYFSVLRVPPFIGRTFSEEEGTLGQDNVVILSHGFWQRRFGSDPEVIGRRIQLGSETRTIIGVMPPTFRPLGDDREFWIPKTIDLSDPTYSGTAGTWPLARLRQGVSLEFAVAEVRAVTERLATENPEVYTEEWVNATVPTSLRQSMIGDVRGTLWTLLGAVGFVLLIACANVANLLLVRAGGRRKEMAIRRALGAARSRIFRQLLTESILLGLLGGAAGLTAAVFGMKLLVGSLPAGVPLSDSIGMDVSVLGFALMLSLVAGLVFGLAPALWSTAPGLQDHLRGTGGGTTVGKYRFQNGLVAAEIALTVVLVVGAGLMLKSLWKLQQVDPGFTAENVLTMRLSPPASRYVGAEQQRNYYARILERLRAVPGVVSVGAVSSLPMAGGGSSTVYEIEGHPQPEGAPRRFASFQFGTPGYLRTLGVPRLEGRWLDDTDRDGTPVVAVINETLAHEGWGTDSPIGKNVRMFGYLDLTVVGVVGDLHQDAPDVAVRPEAYVSINQMFWTPNFYLTIRTAYDPEAAIASLKNAAWSVDRDVPISRVRVLEDVVSRSIADSRFTTLLLAAFGGLALLLGAVGVYGVMAYVVSQRTREVGIRVALGADSGRVLRTSMVRGMIPVGVGVALGIAGAVAATRLLASLLFEVTTTDSVTFILVPLFMIGVAAAAAYLPARRAAYVDPMIALSTE